jgi:hypothetical protein
MGGESRKGICGLLFDQNTWTIEQAGWVPWCFILGKIFSLLFSGGAVVIGMSEIPSWVFYRLSNKSGSATHDQCVSDIRVE